MSHFGYLKSSRATLNADPKAVFSMHSLRQRPGYVAPDDALE